MQVPILEDKDDIQSNGSINFASHLTAICDGVMKCLIP